MRQIVSIVALMLALLAIGTLGFRLVEDLRWLDALFMAVTTLSTVGYTDEVAAGRSFSDAGKLFAVVYIVFGFTVFTYSAFTLGQLIVNAEFRRHWGRRRMDQTIEALHGHFLVCGVGRMGRTICHYLAKRGQPFVAIDRNEDRVARLREAHGWLAIVGDATSDQVLHKAGIARAAALATVLPTDSDNVYVTLSAHLLQPRLKIVARASDDAAVEKLQRAGASRVVSPYSSGATKIARFMLHPSIEDFFEIADERGRQVELADVLIGPNSPYAGKALSQTNLRDQGVMVLAIRKANGEQVMPPSGSTPIAAGDCLFVFGSSAAVNRMIQQAEQPPVI
jgi:voltage-gated potassium channel